MMSDKMASQSQVVALGVRRVGIEEPTAWLEAGWHDLWRSPASSLSYGLAFAVFGWALAFGLEAAGLGSLILPLAAGFMLIGPLAAVGLYELSRCHALGQPATLRGALGAWRRNGDQIGMMGVALLVALFAWIQVALIIFALFFRGAPPSLAAFGAQLVSSTDNIPFLVIGTLAGGVLAAVVFSVSAVSLPMLLDRQVTAAEAVIASIAAVRRNRAVMLGWGLTLALLTGLGVATGFLGLIVTLPLAGHASWHAYRGLIQE
jgi:uncharacterized membrane protein